MLDKQAISEIPVSPETPGFYSPIFLVAKESGGWRPILNLKAFNKFVVPPSFRMETLRTVMDCLGEAAQQRQNTSEHLRDLGLSEKWAISIDLRDAYFHVAVAPEHTRYLRFAYNGRAFDFLVLPFGLSTAPRVFTRIVRVIEAFLKVQGVDMNQCLDDWLMKSLSKSLVERHRDLTLFWVNKLGNNEGKSQLTPTQAPAFLGLTLYLLNMLVFPSKRRILRATRLAASLLARTAQPAKTWQRFLGHLSSLRELVPMAVVHTRPIQLMLHDQWTQVLDSPYVHIHPNEATLAEWWTSQANLRVGRPFLHQDPTMSIVTDASKEGLGGHLGNWVSGHWSRAWAKRHINWLELQAVWLTLKHFLPQLQGTAMDVISDNSTTVAYINKVGGTQSPSLCHLALDVWAWCRQHDIFLVASHLSGDKKVPADALSRGSHRHPTEWTLHKAVSDLSTLANPSCGPVRVGEEPQAASVLLNPAVPVIERCEHADAELGMPLRICISTDGTRPESVAEVEASTDGAVLAQPAVVPPTDVDADGSAAGDLPEGRSPEECGHGDAVPQTGGDEVNCMASVRKSFVDPGFSANVADTAARAR